MVPALLWLACEAAMRCGTGITRIDAASSAQAKEHEARKATGSSTTLPAPVVRRLGGTPAACRLRLRVWGWTASAYVLAFTWFVFAG